MNCEHLIKEVWFDNKNLCTGYSRKKACEQRVNNSEMPEFTRWIRMHQKNYSQQKRRSEHCGE
jgi:hypothetical protein